MGLGTCRGAVFMMSWKALIVAGAHIAMDLCKVYGFFKVILAPFGSDLEKWMIVFQRSWRNIILSDFTKFSNSVLPLLRTRVRSTL